MKLIDSVKEHIDCLREFGPQLEIEKMMHRKFDYLKTFLGDELELRIAAAKYEQENASDEMERKRYKDLFETAKFRATLKNFNGAGRILQFKKTEFIIEKNFEIDRDGTTMARIPNWDGAGELAVLIEWIPYTRYGRYKQRDDVAQTARMLSSPKPGDLLLPGSFGVVESIDKDEIGLVLIPPGHICTLPQQLPSDIFASKWLPITLKDLMLGRHSNRVYRSLVDLRTRFILAKRLFDAVHTMHVVGWSHE
jgi:hypothetical protein